MEKYHLEKLFPSLYEELECKTSGNSSKFGPAVVNTPASPVLTSHIMDTTEENVPIRICVKNKIQRLPDQTYKNRFMSLCSCCSERERAQPSLLWRMDTASLRCVWLCLLWIYMYKTDSEIRNVNSILFLLFKFIQLVGEV